MSNLENIELQKPIDNQVESVSSPKKEALADKESLQVADGEMFAMLEQAKESNPTSSSATTIIHLKMSGNPKNVKKLITSNFTQTPKSSIQLKQARQKRIAQAMANFGHAGGTTVATVSTTSQFIQDKSDLLSNAVSNSITGQTQNISKAQKELVKYMIKVLGVTNPTLAAQLYAAYYYNDKSVFDKFTSLEQETMKVFNRYVDLVQKNAFKK
jgi:hypothetical protein